MKKVGRNDPCPCGSGKKFKNCHQKSESKNSGKSKLFTLGLILIIFIVIAVIGLYIDSQRKGGRPPGPAPAGKVWSDEHGHYH